MAADWRKPRKSNFSQEEIDVLTTTVLQNHDILYKETSKSYFHKEIRNQVWNIILEEVNKVSQERRTLNEIKNKWKKCQYSVRPGGFSDGPDYREPDEYELDAMPLRQRLTHGHETTQSQEPVLQSLPISPTKLKVTRQGKSALPQQPPSSPHVCLKWNSHHMNMQTAFPNLLTKEQYVDATLVSEGKTLKCHRIILSSCSPYFEEVLNGIGPFQHPVIFMKDVSFWTLKALCDFMYAGEVHILQERLPELLRIATSLKIKGLANSPENTEDIKPQVTPIKQESEPANSPPPEMLVDQMKEETIEETLPVKPTPSKPSSVGAVGRPRKKDDKKAAKHVVAPIKEKDKEKMEEQFKAAPSKPPAKVVSKSALPKVPPAARTTVRNPIKANANTRPTGTRLRNPTRRVELRRTERHKPDLTPPKDKEKEKEPAPLKKDNINDPLDLLQPVYEEIAKTDTPNKLRERGNIPVRKSMNKKVKKRRYADYHEEREESPPLLFSSRKGTRSRPNVKVPKFFHTTYTETMKETSDATIVREPHTNQNDPLEEAEVEEIKAEPFDLDENTMEIEENCMDYLEQDQELHSQDEEIIGNYDSPLVNIKREPKQETPNIFTKELSPKPIIVDVHSVTDTDPGLLSIKKEDVQLVDIGQISTGATLPIETIPKSPSNIIISNVQSMAEMPDETRLREPDKGDDHLKTLDADPLQADPLADEQVLNIQIAEVRSGVLDNSCEDINDVSNEQSTGIGDVIADEKNASDLEQSQADITVEENESESSVAVVPSSQESIGLEAEDGETVELSTMDAEQPILEENEFTKDEIDETAETVEDIKEIAEPDKVQPLDDEVDGATMESTIPEEAFEDTVSPLQEETDGAATMETLPPLPEEIVEDNTLDNVPPDEIAELSTMDEETHVTTNETLPPLDETFELEKEQNSADGAAPEEDNQPDAMDIKDLDLCDKEINQNFNDSEAELETFEYVTDQNEQCEADDYDPVEEDIGYELEQCLASTSTELFNAKGDVRFKVSVKPSVFDDDEDFTKDIELDSLPVINRPTNYLGDNYEDFEMDNIAESSYKMEDVESRDEIGDEDVIMKDATTSHEGSERADEKTLEMIVNDLNASLGDMTK